MNQLTYAVEALIVVDQFDRAKSDPRARRFRKINCENCLDFSGDVIAMLNE